MQERWHWRRERGEESKELQAPRSGCLEEQLSLAQGQGQALPGMASWELVAGKLPHPVTALHSRPCQPPPQGASPPQQPGLGTGQGGS